MIEMQYNFPLLPGQGAQWQQRLRQAVATLDPADPAQLRPTFRSDRTAHRTVAARWLGSTPETTWITCGGHHGALIALLAAGLAGKTLAVDEITYTGILEQAKMLGCRLVGVAFDAQGMVPEALHAACQREAAGTSPIQAIFTMPTVHNPLGCVAGLARREAIATTARAFGLLILEDDAYGYMEPDPPPSYAILAPERTFYIRGLSKSYAPATHTGLLVAPVRFTAAIETAIKSSTTGTALVNNIAALSLVADGSVDAVIAQKREEGARRNAAARALLGAAAAPGAACAWLLWVQLPEDLTPQAAQAHCAERGVLVSGGHGFAAPGVTVHGLRIALGGEVDAARTLQGVRVVAEVVRALGTL
jgi:DNA-binding transcriptional MocR family regulator